MRPRPDNSHVELQARDLSLLRGLFESRIMGLDHVAAMYFDGRREAAQKRVQKLKAAGYVAERPRRSYERALLFLTRRAFDALHASGHLGGYPSSGWSRVRKRMDVSPYTIAHETAVLDVKAAFVRAVADLPALVLDEFSTWPAMLQFTAAPRPGAPDVSVKPDGFIRLRESRLDGPPRDHHFYLEVDRSTEPQGTLVLRAACYRNYQRRGGETRSKPASPVLPFRVLMVFKTAQRRDHTAERLLLLNPPIRSHVWLTTYDEVIRDPLGAIWLRPIDYRRPLQAPDRHSLHTPDDPLIKQFKLFDIAHGDARPDTHADSHRQPT